MRSTATLSTLAAALCLSDPLSAQRASASLSAGAVSVSYEDAPATRAITLSPSLILRTRGAYLALLGSLAQVESSWSPQGTLVVSTFTPPTSSGVLGEVGFSVGGSSHSDGESTGQGALTARLHWQGPAVGSSIGGAIGSTWSAQEWRAYRAAELSLLLRRPSSLISFRATPTATADDLRFTDLSGAVDGAIGIVDLGASIGGRVGAELPAAGSAQRLWGGVSVAVWVAPRASIVTAVGSYPSDLTQGFPSGRYLSVSMRLGGWRSVQLADAATARAVRRDAREAGISDVELRPEPGRLEIRIRALGASSVEMMGDLTQWSPRSLQRGADGWWTVTLEGAGATELVVRVDGGPWTLPPGADVATDEFGGRVGRLIIPEPGSGTGPM